MVVKKIILLSIFPINGTLDKTLLKNNNKGINIIKVLNNFCCGIFLVIGLNQYFGRSC